MVLESAGSGVGIGTNLYQNLAGFSGKTQTTEQDLEKADRGHDMTSPWLSG